MAICIMGLLLFSHPIYTAVLTSGGIFTTDVL